MNTGEFAYNSIKNLITGCGYDVYDIYDNGKFGIFIFLGNEVEERITDNSELKKNAPIILLTIEFVILANYEVSPGEVQTSLRQNANAMLQAIKDEIYNNRQIFSNTTTNYTEKIIDLYTTTTERPITDERRQVEGRIFGEIIIEQTEK